MTILKELCKFPRVGTYDGVSSEITMDQLKEESAESNPISSDLRRQLIDHVILQLLTDLPSASETTISDLLNTDLQNSIDTLFVSRTCYENGISWFKI
jgi:hypothetical protein